MFKLSTAKNYVWPITVEIPADGGTWTKASFKASFKLLPQSRINEIVKGERQEDDEDLLREVLVGFEGVADEDGNPIPYSDEARDQLIDIPYARVGLIKAFFTSISGRPRKN